MKLADILSTDPATGRALITIPGYPATLVLACHARDIHPMGALQRWLAGPLVPGMTWRNGIAINEELLALPTPEDLADTFLHEGTHWWQIWKRMGPNGFGATYAWRGVLIALVRFRGLSHIHDDEPIENEARASALAMRLEIVNPLRMHQPRYDAAAWLQVHLPALR